MCNCRFLSPAHAGRTAPMFRPFSICALFLVLGLVAAQVSAARGDEVTQRSSAVAIEGGFEGTSPSHPLLASTARDSLLPAATDSADSLSVILKPRGLVPPRPLALTPDSLAAAPSSWADSLRLSRSRSHDQNKGVLLGKILLVGSVAGWAAFMANNPRDFGVRDPARAFAWTNFIVAASDLFWTASRRNAVDRAGGGTVALGLVALGAYDLRLTHDHEASKEKVLLTNLAGWGVVYLAARAVERLVMSGQQTAPQYEPKGRAPGRTTAPADSIKRARTGLKS